MLMMQEAKRYVALNCSGVATGGQDVRAIFYGCVVNLNDCRFMNCLRNIGR